MSIALEYLAAKAILRILNAVEIGQIAKGLLDSGYVSDECRKIVDFDPPRLDDVQEPLMSLLASAKVELPDREMAVWWIIYYHTSRMTSGLAIEALGELVQDLMQCGDYHLNSKVRGGDGHGVEELVALHYVCDELVSLFRAGEADLDKLEQEIVAAAKHWTEKYLKIFNPDRSGAPVLASERVPQGA